MPSHLLCFSQPSLVPPPKQGPRKKALKPSSSRLQPTLASKLGEVADDLAVHDRGVATVTVAPLPADAVGVEHLADVLLDLGSGPLVPLREDAGGVGDERAERGVRGQREVVDRQRQGHCADPLAVGDDVHLPLVLARPGVARHA